MLRGDDGTSATLAAGIAAADGFSPLADCILAGAAGHPDDIAIVDNGGAFTYGALADWTRRLAEQIAALPGSAPVAMLLPNNTAFVVAVLAAQLARRTYVPIDAEFPDERARQIVNHACASALIVDAETEALAARVAPQLARIVVESPKAMLPQHTHFAVADPGRIASITYTSGSTGVPKGVIRTEEALLTRVRYFASESGLGPQDRVPILLPLATGSTLNRVLGALLMGAQLCLVDLRRTGAGAALRTLGDFRPTVYFMVPSLFRALFRPDEGARPELTRDVRWVRLGADRVLRSDVELYRRRFPETCRLWISIGSNETHTYASWHLDHATPLDRPLVPVGYPRPGIDLTIADEDGKPVPAGEIGEIVIASERLAEGYWANDPLTRARFAHGPAGAKRYRTGDFGRLLHNGLLEFVGRRDRQMKVRGNTIHLSEIEAALDACPCIAEASVIARTTAGEVHLIVYCVAATQAALPAIVRAAIRDRLPKPMWPSDVIVVDALPRLPGGKIDLEELQRLDRELADAASGSTSPPARTVSRLAGIVRDAWDNILGPGAFDSGRSFENAGGHSLAAMQILLLLEQKLGRALPVDLLGPDVQPDDVVKRLSSPRDSLAQPGDALPHLLLFPQLFGTGFAFQGFVRRLDAHFHVRVMNYGDADGQTIATIDPEAYFDAILHDVLAAGPPKRLWIVGYVFGCRVAAEAARRLQARGVAVEFIGLIAGLTAKAQAGRSRRRGGSPRPPLRQRLSSYNGLHDFFAGRVTVRLARRLQRWRATAVTRTVIAVLYGAGLRHAAVDTILMARKHAAEAAFKSLPQDALPLPVTVFATTAETSESRYVPDLGWSEFCQDVTVVPVPGRRRDMLEGVGADAILAAMTLAETTLRTTFSTPDNERHD